MTRRDPAAHSERELEALGVRRLPDSPTQALAALEKSPVVSSAMGPMLFDAFVAVRKAEAGALGHQDPEAIAATHRWRY